MRLSAEQFAELTASFTSGCATEDPDRRRAARLELQTRVKISLVESGHRLGFLYVDVKDFSARGLAFIHNTEFKTGQQFITSLPRKHGGIVELLCTVAHCVEVSKGVFRIGAEFTCALPSLPLEGHTPEGDAREAARIRHSMLD